MELNETNQAINNNNNEHDDEMQKIQAEQRSNEKVLCKTSTMAESSFYLKNNNNNNKESLTNSCNLKTPFIHLIEQFIERRYSNWTTLRTAQQRIQWFQYMK